VLHNVQKTSPLRDSMTPTRNPPQVAALALGAPASLLVKTATCVSCLGACAAYITFVAGMLLQLFPAWSEVGSGRVGRWEVGGKDGQREERKQEGRGFGCCRRGQMGGMEGTRDEGEAALETRICSYVMLSLE